MAISLAKNQTINLTKESDLLKKVLIEASWDTPNNIFPAYDVDISAFLLGSDGKLLSEEGFIFFNQPGTSDGSIWKSPDQLAGGVEQITIDLEKLAKSVAEISLIASIHKAAIRKQSFDKVKDAKIQIFNSLTKEMLAEFKLDQLTPGTTSVQVGSFYLTEEGFTFQAVEACYELPLDTFFEGYSS